MVNSMRLLSKTMVNTKGKKRYTKHGRFISSVDAEDKERLNTVADRAEGLVHRLRAHHTDLAVAREICEGLLKMIPAVDTEEWRRIRPRAGEGFLSGSSVHSSHLNAMATYRVLALTGVIGVVVQALKVHLDAVDLTVSACKILRCLMRDSEDLVVQMEAAGGIEAGIAAIKTHPNSAAVAAQACKLLSFVPGGSRSRICACGGIKAVVEAMKQHAGSAEVAEAACFALAVFATNDYPNAYGIGACGGNRTVIAAMTQHVGNAAVVTAACCALSNLALIANNQADIGACGGVKAVFEARKKHAGDTALAEAAEEALYSITWENPALLAERRRYESEANSSKGPSVYLGL